MGAMIAYKLNGGSPDTSADGRREGGVILGAALSAITGANPRDELLAALLSAQASCALFYGFRDEANQNREVAITALAPAGSRKIVATLADDMTGVAGELTLTVDQDQRTGDKEKGQLKKRKFDMAVWLPEQAETDGFSYVADIAEDVLDLANKPKAQNYLVAFKLLSRCK